jgi:hypothetical protein
MFITKRYLYISSFPLRSPLPTLCLKTQLFIFSWYSLTSGSNINVPNLSIRYEILVHGKISSSIFSFSHLTLLFLCNILFISKGSIFSPSLSIYHNINSFNLTAYEQKDFHSDSILIYISISIFFRLIREC